MAEAGFGAVEAARLLAVPSRDDDKYSRGVLGFVTGSDRYPGAAVLGVDAALHTGVGMVRYLGPKATRRLVLQRRPEVVTVAGRVQAWVLGSGQDAEHRANGERHLLEATLLKPVPTVLDSGALDLHELAAGPTVLTPHAGELARLLQITPAEVTAEPERRVRQAAVATGCVVLLKGHTTRIAAPDGRLLAVAEAPTWLATAGAGDALAGILGALLATRPVDVTSLPELAAAAAVIHGRAAARASTLNGGGPFTILELNAAIAPVVGALITGRSSR